MKHIIVICLVLSLIGCSKGGVEGAEVTPEIICGEGRNIVVLRTKQYFLPIISGDVKPLTTGECEAFIPNGGFIVIECGYNVLKFKNGEKVILTDDFTGGFNFYYSTK